MKPPPFRFKSWNPYTTVHIILLIVYHLRYVNTACFTIDSCIKQMSQHVARLDAVFEELASPTLAYQFMALQDPLFIGVVSNFTHHPCESLKSLFCTGHIKDVTFDFSLLQISFLSEYIDWITRRVVCPFALTPDEALEGLPYSCVARRCSVVEGSPYECALLTAVFQTDPCKRKEIKTRRSVRLMVEKPLDGTLDCAEEFRS